MSELLSKSVRILNCVIPSRLEAVDKVCLEVRSFLKASGNAHGSFAVELVARECLNNAILHGNKMQPDKKATLSLRLGRRWMRLEVADEGPGFNWRKTRRATAAITDTHGRGIAIGLQYADRIQFNQQGNRITLWMDNIGKSKRHNHG